MQNNTFSGLYIGQKLIVIDEVESTNDYLKNIMSNIKPLAEGTAIMARHQTKGKGQRGNHWQSKAGENLTLSILLYPEEVSVHDQFILSVLSSLSVYAVLSQYLSDVRIKWPNDLMVGDKKIGGILIENSIRQQHIKTAIVGIGININQRDFGAALQGRVCSMSTVSGRTFAPKDIALEIMRELMRHYAHYKKGEASALWASYKEKLYRLGVAAPYKLEGVALEGIIRDVNAAGQLLVDFGQETLAFNIKEISYTIGG